MVVLPLYARLTREEQERVFDDVGNKRKVILATNIAETSITIPDVRYVVDCGLAKVPRYSPRTGITALREELISRGSAEQRAGRAGRTGPGIALRLYEESSFAERPQLTEEEILRLELSEVVLRLIDLGVRELEQFPFPTPPPPSKLRAAVETLTALGAIDRERELTSVGKRMVPFPLAPRLSRMVIEAAERFPAVVDDVLVAGAFISGRSPFVLPEGEVEEAREAHQRFCHPLGDAVTQVALYRAWQKSRNRDGFCAQHYLDPEALSFAERAHQQLVDIAHEQSIEVRGGGPREELVRAVTSGLADQVIRRRGNSYVTATGTCVRLHPSSVLFDEMPDLAVAMELVEHSRMYAINVSAVRKEWLRGLNVRALEKGRRATKAADAAPPTLTELVLGGLVLPVTSAQGRLSVDLSLEQLPSLKDVVVPVAAKKVRARVRWNETYSFAGLALDKIAVLVRMGVYPSPADSPVRDLPLGQLLESERDRHRLEWALEHLLKPGVTGRSAGWVAFAANGVGGYWLDVLPHYRDALTASRISAESLATDLYEGDPLRERGKELAERLAKLEEGFEG